MTPHVPKRATWSYVYLNLILTNSRHGHYLNLFYFITDCELYYIVDKMFK